LQYLREKINTPLRVPRVYSFGAEVVDWLSVFDSRSKNASGNVIPIPNAILSMGWSVD